MAARAFFLGTGAAARVFLSAAKTGFHIRAYQLAEEVGIAILPQGFDLGGKLVLPEQVPVVPLALFGAHV